MPRELCRQPAGRGVFLGFEEEAKTSGPAGALADNANAGNGERRFHGGLYRAAALPRQARRDKSVKRTEFHQIRVEDGKKLLSLIIQIEPIRRRRSAAAKFLSKSNTISVGERNAQNQGQGKMARKTGKTERKP